MYLSRRAVLAMAVLATLNENAMATETQIVLQWLDTHRAA